MGPDDVSVASVPLGEEVSIGSGVEAVPSDSSGE